MPESLVPTSIDKISLLHRNKTMDYKLWGFCMAKCIMNSEDTFFYVLKESPAYNFISGTLKNKYKIPFEELLLYGSSQKPWNSRPQISGRQDTFSYMILSFKTTSSFPVDQMHLYSPSVCCEMEKAARAQQANEAKTSVLRGRGSSLERTSLCQASEMQAKCTSHSVHKQFPKRIHLEDLLANSCLDDRIRFVEGFCIADELRAPKREMLLEQCSGFNFSEESEKVREAETEPYGRLVNYFLQEFRERHVLEELHLGSSYHTLCFAQANVMYSFCQILSTICSRYDAYFERCRREGLEPLLLPLLTGIYRLSPSNSKVRAFGHSAIQAHDVQVLQNRSIQVLTLAFVGK
jgi:hypothetical protein